MAGHLESALTQVAVGVADDRAADTGAAFRLIEVRLGSCLRHVTRRLRPALCEVAVCSALLRDPSVGPPIGIWFCDLPLPCARGEGKPGGGRKKCGGDDALDLLCGVHDVRFAAVGMPP